MKRWLVGVLCIGALSTIGTLGAWGCSRKEVRAAPAPTPAAVSDSLTLFISADLRGYLGPCGCSENMRGGIARSAQQISDARAGGHPVVYVDSGDSLFHHAKLEAEAVPQEERKARALADAFLKMGIGAFAVGERDDARGAAFRKALGLPELLPNTMRLVEAGGRQIGVVSASDVPSLVKLSGEARAAGAVLVLGLYRAGLAETRKAAGSEGLAADVLVAASVKDELSGEENVLARDAVPVVQLQSKGRSILRLDLSLRGAAGEKPELQRGQADVDRELSALEQRIELLRKQVNEPSLRDDAKAMRKSKLEEIIVRRATLAAQPLPTVEGKNVFSARFIPLESNFPSSPEVTALVTEYDRDVGKLNLAWAKEHGQDCPAPAPGKQAFVGSEACRDCHDETFPVFEASKHAHAYKTLEEVGKNFHLDCVKCHVTGPDQPGGVCRIDKVAGRTQVGCESCHGPSSLHVEDPRKDNVISHIEPKHCVGCHDPENSPHFAFQSYLAQILGPGHGKPLPGKEQSPDRRRK